jgi:beta-exotoxin I transport system permease protein
MDIVLGNPIPRWQLIAGNLATTALSLLAILAFLGLCTWISALFGRYFLDALGSLNEGM